MSKEFRILFIEDIPTDAELNERELRRAGIVYTSKRVETKEAFLSALAEFNPDIILSDYGLPQFNGLEALRLLREGGDDTPFILITGSLTEEVAVECMKAGANDYVLKTSLKRLPSAVTNALEKAEARRARAEAAEARRRSEERYRDLFENANDLIYTQDLRGNFTSLNKAGERITGYTREEALRMGIADMVAPEHLSTAREMTGCKLSGEEATSVYELEIVAKDGRRVALELSTRLIHHGGEIIGVQGIGRDITERRRAEKALRESEERYRVVAETASDAIITIDRASTVLFANTAAEKIFGYPAEELIGSSLTLLMPDYLRRAHEAGLKRYAETGRRHIAWAGVEVPGLHRDGHEIPLEVSFGESVKDGEHHFTGIIRDITERRRAEEARRQSEIYFKSLIENSSDLISIFDAQGIRRYTSPSVERVLGYKPEELLGKSGFELLHPEDVPTFRDLFGHALRNPGIVITKEFRALHKDGSWRVLEATGSNLLNNPAVAGFVLNSRDVTERKQAEAASREAEEKYRGIFENAVEGIFQSTPDGRFIAANPALARMLGYESEAELLADRTDIGRSHYVDPSSRSGLKRVLEESGIIQGFECEVYRKDGTKIWTLENVRAVNDTGGALLYYEGTIEDITERRRAEKALRESEEFNKRILESSRDCIKVLDLEGRLLYVNPGGQRLLEIDNFTSCQYAPWAEFWTGADRQNALDAAAEARAGDIGSFEGYCPTMRGTPKWWSVVISPIVDAQGRVERLLSVSRDVTERKQTEEALSESEERLRQSQKMESIGVLAGGVAHDFNNLLTVIQGNTQLALRKLPPDDPARQRLDEVERAAQRAAVLTRQLLAFSRRQRLERRVLGLNDTVNDIMKMLQRIIGEDVEIDVSEAPGLFPAYADPAQVEQVVMNLAVNARDAMPGGGRLRIETSNAELDEAYCRQHPYVQPGRYVELRVSDTGVGMDAETRARIFEPFFTTKEVGKGTGLGLSMVYGIVKQHEGHINVYSEPGQGTTFKVYFPVAEQPVREDEAPAQLPALGGAETILVAEDEEALRILAKEVLEALGYRVLLAKNGEEAVRLFEAEGAKIDLLLFDVMMPRLGGREAYEQICATGGGVPVIFMTGYSVEMVQKNFVEQNRFIEECGATMIQKPYSVEGLGRKVREALDAARRGASSYAPAW